MQHKDHAWLKAQYLDNGKSAKEIAELAGVTPKVIYHEVRQAGLKKYAPYPQRESEYDPDQIREWYLEEGLTAAEIAQRLGKTEKAIQHQVFNAKLIKLPSVAWDEGRIDKACPVFNYFAGLVATDGYVDLNSQRVSVRLQVRDREVLDALAEHFKLSTGVRLYKHGTTADLTLPSKQLVEYLDSEFGITRQKTFSLTCSQDFTNDECLKMYLRGVIDGDGNLNPQKQGTSIYVRVYCASDEFIEGILGLINGAFGFSVNLRYANVNGRRYPGFEFGGEKAIQFLDWLYDGYPNLRIARKHRRFETVKSNRMKI